MIRLDMLLFGYYKLYIDAPDRARAYSRLIAKGYTASSSGGAVFVGALRKKKYDEALSGISYRTEGPFGALGFLNRYKRRAGVISGVILSLFLFLFSSLFVWDVRFFGNEAIPDAVLEGELSMAGLDVGRSWLSLSLDEVEGRLMESSDLVGWVNVNRKGCVAYVSVGEKTEAENSAAQGASFCNVVAAFDCVIEEITVKSGMPAVKVGDTVRAGDILISGVIPPELGGGFVRAEGDVIGRTAELIEVFVSRKEERIEYGEEVLDSRKIKIFNFSLNIFKNYRNLCAECVIIEDTEEWMLFGKHRLPFETVSIYTREKRISQAEYTDAQLVSIGSHRIKAASVAALCDAELMRIRTEGELSDDGYTVRSYATVLRDAGKQEKIFAD